VSEEPVIKAALIVAGAIILATYLIIGQQSRFHIRLREDLRLIADRLWDIHNKLDGRR
jgi:hypothetical protein